jgi:hypothetical protein
MGYVTLVSPARKRWGVCLLLLALAAGAATETVVAADSPAAQQDVEVGRRSRAAEARIGRSLTHHASNSWLTQPFLWS